MSRFLRLWFQRTLHYLQGQIAFLSSFCEKRLTLYADRCHSYSGLQGAALVLRSFVYGFFLGFVRLTLYSLSLSLGLVVIPFRLLVELKVSARLPRRFLLFLCDGVESALGLFGILNLGPRFHQKAERVLQRLRTFCQSQPLHRLLAWAKRVDQKTDYYPALFLSGVRRVVVQEWWDHQLPKISRFLRYKYGVRRSYLRLCLTDPVWLGYDQRAQDRYVLKLTEGSKTSPGVAFSKLRILVAKVPFIFLYGVRGLALILRAAHQLERPFFLGYRCRRPKRDHRIRIRRNGWD